MVSVVTLLHISSFRARPDRRPDGDRRAAPAATGTALRGTGYRAWGDRWPAATAVGSGDSLKSAGADAGAGRVGARHDETWKS